MKKKGKYLKFYEECMENGKIPESGLCKCLDGVDLFRPYGSEITELFTTENSFPYWGSGLPWFADSSSLWYGFTPLRQNIVLFLAAINGEL